jgi:organic radical activating enzyme
METPEKSSKKLKGNWQKKVSAEDFDKLSEQSKSFCPLLYYHLTIDTVGNQKLCCTASTASSLPDQIKVSNSNNSIEDWWNSDYLKKSRKMLGSNSYPIECMVCKDNDEMGLPSFRSRKLNKIRDNEQLRTYIYNQANEAIKNNFTTPSPAPIDFDIKFGNLCNLKCRMCDFMSSSQILKEVISNPELEEFRPGDIVNIQDAAQDKDFRYFEKDNFIQSFEKVIDNTIFLKFTGGEPLLISNLFKVLQGLIDRGLSKQIQLQIITNATKITKEMIENYFVHFKLVTLTISLDGYESNYEYVRYPAKWKTLKKNLDLTMNYPKKIHVNFSVTFQPYTCISMIRQYEFMQNYGLEWDLYRNGSSPVFIKQPVFLDLKLMPNKVKLELQKIYQSSDILKKLPKGYKKDWITKLKYLSYKNKEEDDLVAIKRFVSYTNALDKIRKQKFKDSCPEEWELLKEYFNDQ